MKRRNSICIFLLALLIIAGLSSASAQQQAPKIGCKNPEISRQAAELKEDMRKQGFEIVNDAMLEMTSKESFPIVVQLKQGEFYQIVFVGDVRSKKMELELYKDKYNRLMNHSRRPVLHESNVISVSFAPEETGNYLLMPMQNLKKEMLCGSITIFKLKALKETGK